MKNTVYRIYEENMMNQTEEKIKFSVVLPIYNVEKYLNRCLDSVMNQTYKKLEIILVDDGSPDNCPQMCDNWAKVDDRIKVVPVSYTHLTLPTIA